MKLLVILFSLASATQNPFAAWKGKYPFDKVKGQAFFETANLRTQLIEILGPEEFEEFREYVTTGGPSSPVEFYQNFLFTGACRRHNCFNEQYELILDLDKNIAYVCHSTEKSRESGLVYWSSKNQKRVASKSDCTTDDFKARLELIPKTLRP